jgi:hypothetical protein
MGFLRKQWLNMKNEVIYRKYEDILTKRWPWILVDTWTKWHKCHLIRLKICKKHIFNEGATTVATQRWMEVVPRKWGLHSTNMITIMIIIKIMNH